MKLMLTALFRDALAIIGGAFFIWGLYTQFGRGWAAIVGGACLFFIACLSHLRSANASKNAIGRNQSQSGREPSQSANTPNTRG